MVSQIHRENDAARRDQEERAHKMAALKKQVEEERKAFKQKVQELQEKYKQKEREELTQRVQMVKDSDKKEDGDGKGSKTKSLKADEEEHFNSTLVMRRILKLAFLNAIQRRHIRQHQKNIEVFEQAFATIKSTTGISDIEEIVKIFVALEQRNFSLLTYVNALNREIESLDKQNRQLKDQLANQQEIEAESDKKRVLALTDLNAQIESTGAATEDNKLQ
ncbi:ODA1, partial [Symbiodinium pilosum]